MLFQLEVLEGPHTGQIFHLRAGTEIGRVRGQILLKQDPKVSGFHAVVEVDADGQLMLVDQKSSNGIKVDGVKLERVMLTDGLVIVLGRSKFRLKQIEDDQNAAELPSEIQKTWKQTLREETALLANGRYVHNSELNAFGQPFRLRFLEGIQTDQAIYVGFGPREFGADTLDFVLQEAVCPAIAFRISPVAGAAKFSTDFPTLVQINGSAETEHELIDGDQIRIGQSLIQVEFE